VAGAEWVVERARSGFRRIALIGQTKGDVRDTMIEVGDSAILNISPPWFVPKYEPSKRRLTWPNGAIAISFSGDEPGQLRGPQFDSVWIDELAKFKYPQETWDQMEFGLRIGPRPQVVITTTPRPIPIIKKLIADDGVVESRGSTYDNIANLAPAFVKRILDRYEGTRLGRQEINAEILEDNPDALWQRENIEQARVRDVPDLARVVVGVDPPGTESGAEAGIVVAGIDGHGEGYVLDDRSLHASPSEWAQAAVTGYNLWKAGRIIGEVNNGGDMVEFTIRTVKPDVSYKAVHASRGKATRAEPIAALYEQSKVHHVGSFPELEDQMCQWVPGDPSPDRLDALVWALTELMLGSTEKGELEVGTVDMW